MEPVAFVPLFMERVWGGRALQERLGKRLPPTGVIGESWEVVDREEAQSVVAAGPRAGRTLQQLWSEEREVLFGARAAGAGERFPLLIKLLDCQQTLSVQVHPPSAVAEQLGGEPKSELWYLAAATPDAHLFAGFAPGVNRERFTAALEAGQDVSTMLHRIPVGVGDALFIPSGRVHAIGAGCLIVEIQQSSDTTYRVFDFNRPGLDGKPRELHIPQSLASIDFDDVAPELLGRDGEQVVANAFFTVTRRQLEKAETLTAPGECAIVGVLEGEAACGGERFGAGSFFLLPAGEALPVAGPASVLVTELP